MNRLGRPLTLMLGMMLVIAPVLLGQQYQIYRKTLDNGLNIIVIQNPSVPLVTVELDVKNGGYTEAPEYNGLSHLYEHMFFKANAAIPTQEKYLDRLRDLGALWNGSTSEERVNYFFTVPKDSLVPAMIFMEDAASSPLFLQDELVKERKVVLGEFDRNESNPFFLLNRAVDRKVWWKYFSRKNVIGDREVIVTATSEKMHTIQNRFYLPNNSALILAGDVTPAEGFALAERYFSRWKRGPDPFTTSIVPDHPPIARTDTVVVEQPVNAVAVMVRWQGPSVSKDPRATYAADVLSFILSQKTSRFYKNLVESGLAYSVNFSYSTLNHTGPITLFAQTSADKFGAFTKAAFHELEQMSSADYFTDAQLENAASILEIDEQYGRERPSTFAHTVGYWWAVAGLDYYLGYVDHLHKVTRRDIDDYLQKYVQGKPYVMGVLVRPDQRKQLGLSMP